jgi:MoCo/4Fe-4S cofactor protein with predicted Tat translocation signal
MSRLKVLKGSAVPAAAASPSGTAVSAAAAPLDVAALRRRLEGQTAPQLWRSLEELAETPGFLDFLHRELPRQASEWQGGEVSRRRFLQLMSASVAMGGLAACTAQPAERIVPYVDMPEGVVPGKPLFFASTHTLGGYGRGVLVESHLGRPTKVEGNPEHPASLGATDAFAQASILDLYDPTRLQVARRLGQVSTWAAFTQELSARMNAQAALAGSGGGSGVRILTGAVTSPTLIGQIERLLAAHPGARWHVWEPAMAGGARAAAGRAGGADQEAVYDLSAADVVLTLDADLLTSGPGALAYARQFTARRRSWPGSAAMAAAPGPAAAPAGVAVAGEAGAAATAESRDEAGGATATAAPAAGSGRPMIRLYSVESTPTNTATLADHRLALPPSEVVAFARAVALELGAAGGRRHRFAKPKAAKWAAEIARDLAAHRGAALVVPGEHAPAELHVLARSINQALGAVGTTVRYVDPVVAGPADHLESLAELVADLAAGVVDVLLVTARNPVFTAPPDLELGAALLRAPFSVYLTPEDDETAEACRWAIPEAHFLESWSDARAFDGTPSLVQPLIEPLYPGARSVHQMVAALAGTLDADGYELVREHWRTAGLGGGGDFERAWRRALHDGVIAGGATGGGAGAATGAGAGAGAGAAGAAAPGQATPRQAAPGQPVAGQSAAGQVAPGRAFAGQAAPGQAPPGQAAPGEPPPGEPGAAPAGPAATASTVAAVQGVEERAEVIEEDILDEVRAEDAGGEGAGPDSPDTLELNFRPDPTIWDGRWANNAWLQELPKPITKLTWDNALLVGPATAERLGVEATDLVDVEWRGRRLTVPVWVVPGHADRSATLTLGYGRRRVGPVGERTGFDAYGLRTPDALWTAPAARVRRHGGRYPLACTQDHHSMEGRDLVRRATAAAVERDPELIRHMGHAPSTDISLFPAYEYAGHAWGMVIDLSACTGCNACVVACQSENSIPTVGKDQVLKAREMHWLRIDRYYEGSLEEPRLHNQPLPCMHCERAPCEVVCPVAATVHGAEGTNDMVYNRCVGTRYCSNNCPYKVRRFNFLQYVDTDTEILRMMRNPDVTVRTRGVMEKCTYCIQRINHGRIEAKREGRRVRDGEVQTACQQACPSDAIVFGDINDAESRVARWRAQPTRYALLEELNTVPRTTYLAKLTNPNPALEA